MDEELWNRWFRDADIGLAVKYSVYLYKGDV